MSKKILDKLTELFISKNKKLEPITAKVWIEKIVEKYPHSEAYILEGIESLIWVPDDFPTLGKLAFEIEKIYEKNMRLLISYKNNELTKLIAQKAGVNIEQFSTYDIDAQERCIERFLKVYKEEIKNNKAIS